MCGIGGFSLSKKSKLSPRSLSNALLAELDVRGNQASGFAYQSNNGSGVYKKDVAGSRLSLKSMPKSAKDVILHTRYATHGSIRDMANNHPIQSPDQSINLVHNGVIYNHDLVRKSLDFQLPEVDTSVIPAILQQFDRNTDKFDMLEGDASVAWLDDNDRGTMRVARISHSPLVIAQLRDGSFVFASTEVILQKALSRLGITPDFMQTVAERTLLEVSRGVIKSQLPLPETAPEFIDNSWAKSYSSYRNMTSGGHGITTSSSVRQMPIQSLWGDIIVPDDWYYGDDMKTNSLVEQYPDIEGLAVNKYGEYYDHNGYFVGDINDMFEWGFIQPDGSTEPWSEMVFNGAWQE